MLYAKFKNERCTLIGCWLAQQLIVVGDVQVMDMLDFDLRNVQCTTCVCNVCVCVWDQTGSKLRSCDWSSFKMNRTRLRKL